MAVRYEALLGGLTTFFTKIFTFLLRKNEKYSDLAGMLLEWGAGYSAKALQSMGPV